MRWVISTIFFFTVFLGGCLFHIVIGQVSQTEVEPEFLAPLENITIPQGRDVVFTCVVNHLGTYKVAWIKSDSKAILAFHNRMVAHNMRLGVTHNGHNTWKLHISNVQKNDSGTYMCQINTDPMRSQSGYLDVVVPPDIKDDESTDGGEALENGTIRLKCSATGTPEPTVSWRREDGKKIILRQESGKEKTVESVVNGEILTLHNVQRTDAGIYLCIATNGVPPTISKRQMVTVHFPPMISVPNQLVASTLDADVVIQCYVEASPKAMHSWSREKGDKIQNSSKYLIEEHSVTHYALVMNLTIQNMAKTDVGGYVCAAANALGSSSGQLRIQEIYDPRTTPSPRHTNTHIHNRPKPTPPPRRPPKQPKPPKETPIPPLAPHETIISSRKPTRLPPYSSYAEADNNLEENGDNGGNCLFHSLPGGIVTLVFIGAFLGTGG